MTVSSVLFLTLLLFGYSQATSQGAAAGACDSITPGHGPSSATDPIPGGFYIYSSLVDDGGAYTADTDYTITLQHESGTTTFKGFLIQAREESNSNLIGSFNEPSGTHHRPCSDNQDSSVTHMSPSPKSSVTFTWTSPSNTGTVNFLYAVVKSSASDYYPNINAKDHRPPQPSTTTTTTTTSSDTTTTTTTSTTSGTTTTTTTTTSTTTSSTKTGSSTSSNVMPTHSPSVCPSTSKTADSSFPIVFRRPDGCTREDCTLYWALGSNDENSDYVDVYMEGNVGGWMALGFSENQLMMSTDVLGCRVTSGSGVEVIDTWNTASGRNNVADDNQAGICTHMAEYTDGKRLKCLFSRYSLVSNSGQDFDLRDELHIIRAFRNASNMGNALDVHAEERPQISSGKYGIFNAPACPDTNKSPSSSFPLTFGSPTGCVRDVNCSLYWAMGPNNENPNFLDVYLEGDVGGWLGVGFSQNQLMRETDVLGCRVNADNTVTAVDGWNPVTRINQLDDSQDGICTHMATRDNGRLSCLFSRYSVDLDTAKDFNLDNSLYIIRGYRDSSNTNDFLMYHTTTPAVSPQTYNPLKDSNTGGSTSPTGCPTGPNDRAEYPVELNNPGDDYYFGSRVNDENSNYLDIILEASADGWVAIGFSETKNMFGADVFACKRESNGDTVNVIDTWNPSSDRTNQLDTSQDGICQHSTEYTDGRIKCTFSRLISITDEGYDLNLNESLYQLYLGVSSSRGSSDSALSKHSNTPVLSDTKLSLASDALTGRSLSATEWPKTELIKTHGVFMIVSWILLASTGIFFASWMRPSLPNGEWFQVHRAVMVASLITGVVGFIFAFIAHARNTEVAGIINFQEPSKGLKIAHFMFGWIIIVFHIANPLIALLRCAPGKPKRWIFNLIHGHLIGLVIELVAFTNIGMGIYLIEKTQADYSMKRAFYVYIVFLIGFFITQLILFVIYTVNAWNAPEGDRPKLVHSLVKYFISSSEKSNEPVKMSDIQKEKLQDDMKEKPAKKKPLKDAPVVISWISASIYVAMVVIVVLVLIVLISIL